MERPVSDIGHVLDGFGQLIVGDTGRGFLGLAFDLPPDLCGQHNFLQHALAGGRRHGARLHLRRRHRQTRGSGHPRTNGLVRLIADFT